jgi:GH24 family phage-related lysozyme (muramidase)
MHPQTHPTFATVRAATEEAAKRGFLTPHQLAALGRLDELLTDEQRREFTELWRAQGSPAAPSPAPADGRPGLADPAWLAPALGIVQDFEGCRLQAYRCPAGVPTIGWGATRYLPPRGAVQMGDTITQTQADELLRRDLLDLRGPGLFTLLPLAAGWAPNRIAALVSWAYNVGLGAVEESTLRRRILAGEDPAQVVVEELPRWNKADGKALEGLARRRAAEVTLFLGAATPPAKPPTESQLRLTRTQVTDSRGLVALRLELMENGTRTGRLLVVSGAPGAQRFRLGRDSRAGSLEPLPQGRWRIEDIAWAAGKDNYSGNWGPGLGPASVPLTYLGPGTTQRSAIEIHYDANQDSSPGTAGCVGLNSIADLKTLVGWLRRTDPQVLVVDWGITA